MKILSILFGLWFAINLGVLADPPPEYSPLKVQAEQLFAEASFAQAHELYARAKAMVLPAAEARWVEFRLADALWRSQAATRTADATELENARHQLEVLIRDIQRVEDQDRVWAEARESLGDYYWARRDSHNWGEAWPHYQAALDWWAGATDVDVARRRYLKIIWTVARPPQLEDRSSYFYGYYGNLAPLEVVENALKIAQTENDRAHAHYLIAMTLRNQGDGWSRRRRVPEEFAAAIKPGKTTDWYADALYNYAEWMAVNGRVVPIKGGGWSSQPDYPAALELFRRLVREFEKGETRYYEQARQEIKNITEPVVSLGVANIFLPGSEIQYALNWRNVQRIDLALYAVDLNREVRLAGGDGTRGDWLQSIELAGREKARTWSRETKDKGDYQPGGDTAHLDEKLPAGAYILEARGAGKSARELVLVTDASVVVKTSGKQALVYVCDAITGAPLAGAEVKLWERDQEGNRSQWREDSKPANQDGLAVFDLRDTANNLQLFVSARFKDRQAFSTGDSYHHGGRNRDEPWRIYAFTDRPAYRPNETAQWKFIARMSDGPVYSTPAGAVVEFQINDPRGAKVKADKATLNPFGSAWGSLELTDYMPLGEYRVTFWNEGRKRQIGSATLFRLEEYKLPEFKVSVQTPEENGRRKAFRLGDTVEAKIEADYFFGGPVANANVEIIVSQTPFYHSWRRPREYSWFYEDLMPEYQRGRAWGPGQGQIIKRETLKTDAAGKAALAFDTPADSGQDFEYRIEARVTDASRREITGGGTVRVTRSRYYVYPEAAHTLYAPQDKVQVDFKTLDANEQPVVTDGVVKVTRDYWREIWLDPKGREIKGVELDRARQPGRIFPPPPTGTGEPSWSLKFRGYEHEAILTRNLKTDTNGMAELTFTPGREGYYRVAWSSEDNPGTNAVPAPPIEAETTVWVATGATAELGYRQGGLEIIVDKDTFRAGQTAPVMLSVPTSDRYVLFTVEGADLYSYQLVHVTGTVKLLELPVEEKHVPNIFLSAALVSDRQLFVDTKQVIVPPTGNFLTVDVQADRAEHQPREEGAFTITTRDDQGRPIPAEVAFGLVDESVYSIQSDYAGDPRQFYFGEKRPQLVQTQSSFNQKSYAKLVAEEGELIDERDREEWRKQKDRRQSLDKDGGYDKAGQRYRFGPNESLADSSLSSRLDPVNGVVGTYFGGINGAAGRGFNWINGNMPMAMPAPGAPMLQAAKAGSAEAPPGSSQGETAAVQVRSDFRSTILWQPDVLTGKDGKAVVKIKYPDSLTGWKATARAVTEANQFGIATANTRTKQPLIVRLQAPRFFVVGDVVTVSAVINNNTGQKMNVAAKLDAEGVTIAGRYAGNDGVVKGELAGTVEVPANGEARVDWEVTVAHPGPAKIKATARAGALADAMERSYVIYEHGLEKFISKSGKVRGDDITVKLDLPSERKADSTTLTVEVTPSLAVTMLDALPYLIDYPYGCTEQTMSRFLPAVITAKTMKDQGLKPEDIMGHLFGGIEAAGARATHPNGKHDLHELDDMTRRGLERLYDFQHSDGGWGWWKEGASDHFMTAYVVWGMALARDAGLNLKREAWNRGATYLVKSLVEEELNFDEQAWMLHALSARHVSLKEANVGQFQTKAFANLWANREKLNAYTRALFALTAHDYGYADKAKILVANLENGVKVDHSPDESVIVGGNSPTSAGAPPATVMGTAHWGEDGIYWRWSDGNVEATAFALRALLAIDPQNKLVEPVMNWLVKNRRGAQWSNTRDTAITVLAMNDYLRVSGELAPDLEYELRVNGQSVALKKVSGADVLSAPSRFVIDPKLIRDGPNEIRIARRGGTGPIYFSADARFFSLEEPVTAAGNEIFVRRQYYKLAGRTTLLKGYVYDRQPLNDGDSVRSGDRVETVLTIEAKNNYEYLLFEDLKPAGFEALEVRSGEPLSAYELKSGAVDRKFGADTNRVAAPAAEGKAPSASGARASARPGAGKLIPRPRPVTDEDHTGRSRGVYQELRDRKVALFIDKLPQGVWEIKYELRAETPGRFHALPVVGHAMYVPEIRCNGAETRINVEDTK